MTDMIIMSCSRTKKRLDNVPAMELYDGQAYRVIRKSSPEDIEILIISAKYGLLRSTDIISYYDQAMTVSQAIGMSKEVSSGIKNTVSRGDFKRIFISLGFPYSFAVSEELMGFLDENFYLLVAHGPIGKRLHQLKEFIGSLKQEALK
jgi:hypothetical protein